MTADKQLKAYIDRVLRLKEEQDALGQDIRDVYAEAKSEGYDKTVMGKLVAHLRKVLKDGDGAVAEAENVFDTYLQAYQRASGTPVATHTHEENFDRETGEILEDINPRLAKQIVDGMQTEAGRAALITAVDIMIEREEAEETQERSSINDEASPEAGPQAEASPAGTGSGTLADREGRHEGEAVSADLPTNFEHTQIQEPEPDRSFLITPGEEKETASVEADTIAASGGEGASKVIFPAVSHPVRLLRPNCQHPAMCRSGTRDHCWSCKRAMQEGAA